MAANDLTSLSRVKTYLGLEVDDEDGLIQALVTRLSQWVTTRINRDIVETTYTIRRNGTGQPGLFLPQYPVTGVTSIIVDGRTLIVETDYWFDDGAIYLINGIFPPGSGNVRVTYTAGYKVIPEDLDESVAELVAFAMRERDRLGATSKTIGGETIAFITKSAPARLIENFDNYRNVVPA